VDFFDLKNIAEQGMELVNPTSAEKVLRVGQAAGLKQGSRVIDFGCGFGEVLALWADEFDISGIGIDIRPAACERARQKMRARGLSDRIGIACMNAAEYPAELFSFDLAACIGATFIWDSFQAAVRAMKQTIHPGGRLVVGEAYWLHTLVPPQFAQHQASVQTEPELVRLARAEGCDVEIVVRASHDDWDRYQSDNWRGLLGWLDEHPEHPDRRQVMDHLHESQDEYFGLLREHLGWAMYLLKPGAHV
jgi:SAM-dependent methyltransferase